MGGWVNANFIKCICKFAFIGAVFATTLARKRCHSLSHIFRAELQTHRQPLWYGCTFSLLVVDVIDVRGIFLDLWETRVYV